MESSAEIGSTTLLSDFSLPRSSALGRFSLGEATTITVSGTFSCCFSTSFGSATIIGGSCLVSSSIFVSFGLISTAAISGAGTGLLVWGICCLTGV